MPSMIRLSFSVLSVIANFINSAQASQATEVRPEDMACGLTSIRNT